MFVAGDLEVVHVLTAPERDPFGDPVPGTEVQRAVPGCLFAPGATGELTDGAQQVDLDAMVYLPAGEQVAATDRLLVRGELFESVGAPRVWGSAGVEVLVRRVTG